MVSTAISRPERDRAQRFVTVGLGVTVVVVAAGVFGQLIDYGLELHIAMLESGGGGGMLGAASDVAMAAAALAAWILLARLWPPSLATTALPVLLTVLAFTKGAPLALATFAVLVIVAQRLSERSRTLLQAALVLLAIAFLIHEGGNSALDVLGAGGDGWAYQVKSVIKHGAEAGGWMIVAIGLAAGPRSR